MQYKIIVDKQSRINPSNEKREYTIDIEELRTNGTVSDSLVITSEEDYVMRRLHLSEYHVLTELEEPVKEPLEDINIELFEGDNYIYIIDMTGNKFYAEYLVNNDFISKLATKVELRTAIEQTDKKVEILASEKLDKDEFATYLEVNPEAVKVAWNKIAEFIQMMIYNDKASLAILNENKNVLATFDKEGQHFYDDSGNGIGDIGLITMVDENKTYLAFQLPIQIGEELEKGMAWGLKTPKGFMPIFSLESYKIENESSDNMGGLMRLSATLSTGSYPLILGEVVITGQSTGLVTVEGLRELVVTDDSDESLITLGKNFENNYYLFLFNLLNMYKNNGDSYTFDFMGNYVSNIEHIYTNELTATEVTADNVPNSDKISSFSCTDDYLIAYRKTSAGGGSLYCQATTSDKKYKKNIKESKINALEIISKIKHRCFQWKNNNKEEKIGYIAQELETVCPALINKIDNTYVLNINAILATSTKAIQEQQEMIENQAKKIDNLKNRLARLEEIINER